MTTFSFLTIELPCDKALLTTEKKLMAVGLRSLRTFDLHAARHTQLDCPCPNHGTAKCDCQMVVLMVYGETAEPVTLILHGSGRQTRLSIADDASQRADRNLAAMVGTALAVTLFWFRNEIQHHRKEHR